MVYLLLIFVFATGNFEAENVFLRTHFFLRWFFKLLSLVFLSLPAKTLLLGT